MRQQWAHLRTATLLVCLLVFALAPPLSAAPSATASVFALPSPSQVTVQRSGVGPFLPLRLGTPLFPGDVIRTGPGGTAEILFASGPHVKINVNSSVRITPGTPAQKSEGLIQAIFGVIWAHLRPGQSIRTLTANIVVRGTDVLVAVDEGGTTLTVVSGAADFVNTQGAVQVAAGQQSVARPGRAPTAPVAVDVSGLIAWTADIAGLPLEYETPEVLGRHDFASEAAQYEADTQRTPADPAAWTRLGQARRGLGDLPGAQAAFAQAIQIAPDDERARVNAALTFLSQDRAGQARAVLEPVRGQAQALAVLGLVALHEDRRADAVRDLTAALAQDKTLYQADALLALALLSQDDLTGAHAAALAAVQTRPDSAQAQGAWAMTLFFEGEGGKAEAASRQAARLNPQSPFALLTQGRVLLARQQIDAALASYERAAGVAPFLWLVHQELGAVYLRLDMPRKAEEEYRAALGRNGDSADALAGLGLALARQGRLAEAETALRRATAVGPDNATAHYDMATFLIERGRLDEARRELESSVRAAPERGILYARLAELSLYRQDLFSAQEFARRAVRLLPDSAQAHYELGRVYLEQERSFQAEQEFRQATTLDRRFSDARFALGLAEEAVEAGRDLSRPLGAITAANQSGAAGALNIQNLQTAGAQERIQAAIQDPAVVRTASRSFGDSQLDARYGDGGVRDFDLSSLHENTNKRGEAGLTAQRFHDDGVRADSGSTSERAGLLFGDKAADNPSGVFVQGQYQHEKFGGDTGVTSDPIRATQHIDTKLPNALAGVNLQRREDQNTLLLVQSDQPDSGLVDITGSTKTRGRSYHGEIRHDTQMGGRHLLIVGAAIGSRRFDVANLLLAPPGSGFPDINAHSATVLRTLQAYVRDEAALSPRLNLTLELKVDRLDYRFGDTSAPLTGSRPTVGLPNAVLEYRPDPNSGIRLRARRLFSTVEDFELLAPRDVFLLSSDDLLGLSLGSRGDSYEMEVDHTFRDASFLRLGVFQQDLRNAFDGAAERFPSVRLRAAQLRYEGILSPTTTAFVDADLTDAQGRVDYGSEAGLGPRQSLSLIPRYGLEAGLQFLDRAGLFAQPSFTFQGSRLEPAGNPGDPRAPIGGFGVLNVRAGKRWGLTSTVFVEVANALDRRYTVSGGYAERLQPGRRVRIGASFRF